MIQTGPEKLLVRVTAGAAGRVQPATKAETGLLVATVSSSDYDANEDSC